MAVTRLDVTYVATDGRIKTFNWLRSPVPKDFVSVHRVERSWSSYRGGFRSREFHDPMCDGKACQDAIR